MNEFSDYGMIRDYESGLKNNISDDDKYSVFDDEPAIEIKPISREEFESYTENERRYYLTELKRRFNVSQNEVSKMIYGTKVGLSGYLAYHGPKGIFSDKRYNMNAWKDFDKGRWNKFIGKIHKNEVQKEKPITKEPKREKEIILMGDGEMRSQLEVFFDFNFV